MNWNVDDVMKQETDKTKKQRQSTSGKTIKPACGTLSYIAECRGGLQKTCPSRGAAPSDSVNRIVRNHPPDK